MKHTKLLLMLAACLTLWACGNDEPEQKQQTEEPQSEYSTTLWNEPPMLWNSPCYQIDKYMEENKWNKDVIGNDEVKDGKWYKYYYGRLKEQYTVTVFDAEEDGYPYIYCIIYCEKSKVSLNEITRHLSERYTFDSSDVVYYTKDKHTAITIEEEGNRYAVVYAAN